MRRFAALYSALDATTKTNEKVAALVTYFRAAPPEDAAWSVYFLSGGRLKRLIGARKLASWALEALELPEWLFNECYDAVGDIAETIALLLPEADRPLDLPLARWSMSVFWRCAVLTKRRSARRS